jgi:membrane associated rhomboid family serine protease
MFIHGDSGHLWDNMIFLWIFGFVLERRIGWKKLLAIYFWTGLISAIIPPYLSIVMLNDLYSAIGASGQ